MTCESYLLVGYLPFFVCSVDIFHLADFYSFLFVRLLHDQISNMNKKRKLEDTVQSRPISMAVNNTLATKHFSYVHRLTVVDTKIALTGGLASTMVILSPF